jgi:hypothetical protein
MDIILGQLFPYPILAIYKIFNKKWLNMDKKITYRKILKCTNKAQIRNLGRYLDKTK